MVSAGAQGRGTKGETMMWFGHCAWGFPGGGGWAWVLGGGLMMLLFWGGLIVLAVLAFSAWQRREARPAGSAGLEVLKARYARGEITRAEYDEIRRELER